MVTLKSLSVYRYCAHHIFWPFGVIRIILSYFEKLRMLKPVLGGVTSVVRLSSDHKQTRFSKTESVL